MPNESFAQYMSELMRLAQDCNFEATQNKMLRDLFVIGVTNEGIQRKLLAVKELDFDKTLEVATNNAKDTQTAQHSSHTIALVVGVTQVMNKDKGKSLQDQMVYRSQSSERKDRRSNVAVVVESTDRKTIDIGIKDIFPLKKWNTYLRTKARNQCVTIAHTW